ncbi:hypothetical protein ATANTOWER_025301 [Ataeniobius toweri]|uniref:Uncharacterized protein n=1 Tax=Ataeniobius toweri TaxID=208326 RepID=A0ABU7BKM5_9TELE|nr:hypothetical protein [Ataeniobius toweri]
MLSSEKFSNHLKTKTQRYEYERIQSSNVTQAKHSEYLTVGYLDKQSSSSTIEINIPYNRQPEYWKPYHSTLSQVSDSFDLCDKLKLRVKAVVIHDHSQCKATYACAKIQ